MDRSGIAMANDQQLLQAQHTPCSSRTASPSTSPEFEFWMVRNPSLTPTNILSADELFIDGILLPLQRLTIPQDETPDMADPPPSPRNSDDVGPSAIQYSNLRFAPDITSEPASSSSKRWMDIFKKSKEKKSAKGAAARVEEKIKSKNDKERRGRNASGSPELNINIWPFTRSESAERSHARHGILFESTSGRKASSAPCSRSNSGGDSKSRVKWPSSPGRVGVHVGRSSPVWQARRGGASGFGGSDTVVHSALKKGYSAETKTKRLNLNVPSCIGYRNSLGCRSEATGPSGARVGSGGIDGRAVDNASGGGVNLFNIRSIFTKNVLY